MTDEIVMTREWLDIIRECRDDGPGWWNHAKFIYAIDALLAANPPPPPAPWKLFAESIGEYVETHNNFDKLTKKDCAVAAISVLFEDFGAAQKAVSLLGKSVKSDQVQFLVNFMDARGLLDDHCFTFPDGDTCWAT